MEIVDEDVRVSGVRHLCVYLICHPTDCEVKFGINTEVSKLWVEDEVQQLMRRDKCLYKQLVICARRSYRATF